MKFGVRKEVNLQDVAGSLEAVSVPVELALPYKLGDYKSQKLEGMPVLIDYIIDHKLQVNAIHAPQGHITDSDFPTWSTEMAQLAQVAGAKVIVYHPENVRMERKADIQIYAKRNIRQYERWMKHNIAGIAVGIEAFGGPKRVLTPEEICDGGFSLVLDTSHLEQDRTMAIINKYAVRGSIVSVHLSERRHDIVTRETMPHMPIQDFGYKVLDRLAELNWNGIVTLEYLPSYHYRLESDYYELIERYPSK